MAEKSDAVVEVEVAPLMSWTTGYSQEQGAVALVLRTADGVEFGVSMPPDEAMVMGKQLSELGLMFTTPVASA